MSRKLWAIFAVSQIIGVGLASYSSRFEVGVGGLREFLWIPAMLLLLPGILLGYATKALDVWGQLARWYDAPFFAVVILLNMGCWSAVHWVVHRRAYSPK